MHITPTALSEALELYERPESAILTKLGSEIAIWESASGQPLGRALSDAELRQKALDFLAAKRESLKQVVCPGWKERNLNDISDVGQLIVIVTGFIMRGLNLTQSYLDLGITLAVLIIKRGVLWLCE
jgi:hypothetical protein